MAYYNITNLSKPSKNFKINIIVTNYKNNNFKFKYLQTINSLDFSPDFKVNYFNYLQSEILQ